MAGKFVNEGETRVGEIFLKKDTVTDLYLGLYKDGSEPAETDTLADLTEVTVANGYARQQIVSANWVEGVTKGEYTNDELTFTASGGDWGSVTGYFICDCSSGTAGDLIAVETFVEGPFSCTNGKSIKVTPTVVIT